MQQRTPAEGVFKILFIVTLILCVVGTALYLPLKLSTLEARRQGKPPILLGRQFIPYTPREASPYSEIEKDSLVFFVDPSEKPVVQGLVVLYPTPTNGSEQNVVFPGYSMGLVASIDESTNVGTTYEVVINNSTTNPTETVSADSVIGVGSTTIKQMASTFAFITSTTGLVLFVIVPAVLSAAFLIMFLRLRSKRKQTASDDEDEAIATPEPIQQSKSKFATATLFQQESPDLIQRQPKSATQHADHPKAARPPLHTQSFAVPLASQSNQDGFQPPEQQHNNNQSVHTDFDLEGNMMSNPHEMLDELQEVTEMNTPLQEYSDTELEIERLEEELRKAGVSLDQSEELTQKQERLPQQEAIQPAPSVQTVAVTDNRIMFILKDNSIDVSFKNIVSNNIDIDYHADGSGFLVKTPKYSANITVVVTSQ